MNFNFVLFKNLYKDQDPFDDSICESYHEDQYNSPINNCEKTPVKKNKTVISKFKKKVLSLSKVFSPGKYTYVNKKYLM